MENPKTFVLRRKIVWAIILLLIPVSLFFAWVTHMAIGQIEYQIAQSGLSSLQLYVNTLHNEILGTEQFLNYLIYEDERFQICASLEPEDFSKAYRDTLSDLLENGFQNNADLTALAVYRPQTDQFYLKLNSMITYEDFEPDVRLLTMRQINKRDIALGWYLAKEGEGHYLCRVMEHDGCFVMAVYDLSQVITNASIFYGQKGNLVLFTGREVLANAQFITNNGLRLDYTIDDGYYFSGSSREFMVVQKQLINFKVALIEPYAATSSSIRIFYFAPALYIVVVLLALAFELIYLRHTLFGPLGYLVQVMKQLQSGDLSARLTGLRSVELLQVQETFNAMVTELISSRIKSYEQQLEIERTQLSSLKMQIRPHFYLNCLKAIFGLAQSGKNAEIQQAVLCLSKHLRYVMNIDSDVIPLEQELQMCENYIRLQKECECGSPEISLSVDTMAGTISLPPVSLLTLVENCVKHATQPDRALRVQIQAKVLETDGQKMVDILVADNGPGFPEKTLEDLNQADVANGGIGLYNVVKRMKLLYGEHCVFHFFNHDGARIEIMLELNPPEKGEALYGAADCG